MNTRGGGGFRGGRGGGNNGGTGRGGSNNNTGGRGPCGRDRRVIPVLIGMRRCFRCLNIGHAYNAENAPCAGQAARAIDQVPELRGLQAFDTGAANNAALNVAAVADGAAPAAPAEN